MSVTDLYASGVFERAKAKVLYEAGRFLQNRDRILSMIDIAGLMQRKGEGTRDSDLVTIAGKLRSKLDGLYNRQLELEDKVRGAMSGLSAAGGSNALELVQIAIGLAPLLRQLAAHIGAVKLAQRATDALKSRMLTGADLATLDKSPALEMGGKVALVGIGLAALWFATGPMRRRR